MGIRSKRRARFTGALRNDGNGDSDGDGDGGEIDKPLSSAAVVVAVVVVVVVVGTDSLNADETYHMVTPHMQVIQRQVMDQDPIEQGDGKGDGDGISVLVMER